MIVIGIVDSSAGRPANRTGLLIEREVGPQNAQAREVRHCGIRHCESAVSLRFITVGKDLRNPVLAAHTDGHQFPNVYRIASVAGDRHLRNKYCCLYERTQLLKESPKFAIELLLVLEQKVPSVDQQNGFRAPCPEPAPAYRVEFDGFAFGSHLWVRGHVEKQAYTIHAEKRDRHPEFLADAVDDTRVH